MSQAVEQELDRFARAHVDKFEVRRGELADAALATLGELGVTRTSLREIARKTEFSHGVLHYYFRDKDELITYCVRRYKEHCVTRYDEIVAEATSADQLAALFADALVGTLLEDTSMHRLWYDMRSQAMFVSGLGATVTDLDRQLEAMVWHVVSRYVELRGARCAVASPTAYAVFDGLFENSLVRHLSGDTGAAERLRGDAAWLIATLARD
ncbi:TetR/AcrR family transcriptional regulator [Oryzobacter telluris]|uniref:TetR/AcrR family transcriptional regulator n=1 Tax=Oryzobacter telluris TaxID=3149179 RepID=UPI00370DD1AB